MGEAWIEGSTRRAAPRRRRRGCGGSRTSGAEAEHVYDRGPDDTFGGGACEWLQRHVVAHFAPRRAPREHGARLPRQPARSRRRSTARRARHGASSSPRSTRCGRTAETGHRSPCLTTATEETPCNAGRSSSNSRSSPPSPARSALAAGAQAQTVLKFSHTDQPGGARQKAAELFGQKVEQYTQGRYKVQVFPAGQLANDPKAIEQLQLGGIDFTVSATGTYATHIADAQPHRCCRTWSRATSRAGSSTTSRSGCRRSSPRRRPRASASSPPGKRASAA